MLVRGVGGFRGVVSLCASRSVSSKYPKPTPRPYRRRLFEAAVAPVLPEKLKVCTPPVFRRGVELEYDEVELALSRLVKKWIISEEFNVLGVCQYLPVPGRTLWLTKNQLRLKGLEFRSYGNRIMRKVFEGTPLSALNPVLVQTNAMLFGKDLSALKTINDEAEKISWLVPLACVANGRIMSMEEVKQFSKVASLADHRVETVQILSSQLGQLSQTLDSQSYQLTSALDQLANRSS
ncbi:hypothetical protein TELCIR_08995 [Teladorsagia circumcincta]|uniref:Large ribosomal subunit protein uL10m n=1 Tax=Teladorsagia circumcincta TaxID=45464 RepID=A0A2G9UG33_TELCI|nr:hypothetical protein TELCIR_08995 [Teladorsagia circumcincta]